jgi:hypothetical protein
VSATKMRCKGKATSLGASNRVPGELLVHWRER